MSARLWQCCLLSLVVWTVRGASHDAPATELVVYLSADSGQSPHVLDSMKHELGLLMQSAGYDVSWREPGSTAGAETAAPLIVVRLRGVCSMPAGGPAAAPLEKAESLGETAMTDGRVIPFSFVNCAGLGRMLGPVAAAEPAVRRDLLFGRAAARVLAHEFYHVLAGEQEHAAEGVAKSPFSPADLTGEHFEFEASTLVKLQRKKSANAVSETAAGDDPSGRNN